jgi:hypothetical protein
VNTASLSARRVQHAEIWWINPWKLGVFFLIPLYVFLFAAPHVFGPEIVTVRFRFYFDAPLFALGLVYLLILFAWAALVVQLDIGRGGAASNGQFRVNRLFLDVLALLAIGAYGLWFRDLILNPVSIIQIFSGAQGHATTRLENETIPGITTATQFGVAYVIFFLHERFINANRFTSRRYDVYFWTLIGLALFRVYTWGERLALIEIVMPVLVLMAVQRRDRERRLLRYALNFAPFIGIVLLGLFFAATEALRSWLHYQYEETSFWEFVLTRMLTYYYTALNNGAGMLAILDWPTWQCEYVLGWLHKFPFLVGEGFRSMMGAKPKPEFLKSFADPEFNNDSGIFTVFYDIGIPLGFLFAAVWGASLGFWYRQMMRGEGLGSLMYPALYLSLLEVLRILYPMNQTRAFPILLAILLGYFLFSSQERRTSIRASYAPS